MRVSKKSSKRVLSFIMALAVALTMCIGFMPQKVLADADYFAVFTDGTVSVNENPGGKTAIGSGDEQNFTSSSQTIVSYADSVLTFNGLVASAFTFDDTAGTGITLKIEGNVTLGVLAFQSESIKIKIQMTKGAKLNIEEVAYGSTYHKTLADAKAAGLITEIIGGNLSADGKTIEAGNDAIDPTSGAGTNTGENTGTDIKVGDTVTPKDGSSKDSATYKVTGTEDGKRSVTYEKPAENASGTEEVKATVTLKDGNEYKVTAIGDGAFKNFEKKDDIAKIIIGDNVEEIGKNACEGLKNVKEVKIGKNVKKIGAKAFKGCVALTKCDVPDNVEEIGESANEGCKKLKNLTIGRKVKKIGKKAYYQSGLKNIKVKSSKLTKASKIGKNAFGKINKKAKVKMKMTKSEARKAKAPTIKVFKNKKIGYVKTWKVS